MYFCNNSAIFTIFLFCICQEIVRLKLPRTAKLSLTIKENGNVSAVGYWFTIHLVDGVVLSTGADSKVTFISN